MVDGQRDVGVQVRGSTVIGSFGVGQQLQVLFDTVGNFSAGCCRNRVATVGLAPGVGGGVGGVRCQFNVFRWTAAWV